MRLPRLYRLLRIFKFVGFMRKNICLQCFRCFRQKDGKFSTLILGLRRILVATIVALFFAHLVACLWFLFSKINLHNEETWVGKLGIANHSHAFQYLVAFYWSVQTLTTVGFGDIQTS